MKRLLCILLAFQFLMSCKNSNEIKEIEILTYYNNARDFRAYSTTQKSGFTQILFKSNEDQDYCQTRIRKSIMDSIISICKNKNDNDFIFKKSKSILYCGYRHSIRVTYENGKKLSFIYPYTDTKNKQFIPFKALSNQIQNDSLNATRLDIGQFGNLHFKQEDLSNLTFKKDSIIDLNYIKRNKLPN